MKKNKVQVIWGEANIDAPGKVTVKEYKGKLVQPAPKDALGAGSYQAKHIIIATGARPRVLPGIEPDNETIWTYFDAMVPKAMPKSLMVIGSGAIGIEFASFYRTLGAEVTVVEMLPQILPVEDEEIAQKPASGSRSRASRSSPARKSPASRKRAGRSPPRSTTARRSKRSQPRN